MTDAEREDMLLSLMRFFQRNNKGPLLEEISSLSGSSEEKVQDILNGLINSGEVTLSNDMRYSLTKSGVTAAEAVMRRHHVLEAFLQEMLGMDHEQAHAQACTMEHHATDDTIKRLRKFLQDSRGCHKGKGQGHGFCRSDNCHGCIRLTDCSTAERVIISAIKGSGRAARLADLGLVPGEEIIVKQKMADTMLIQVKGCDIALSPEIARSVLVEVPV